MLKGIYFLRFQIQTSSGSRKMFVFSSIESYKVIQIFYTKLEKKGVRSKSFLRELYDHPPIRTEDINHEAKEEHIIMTESPLHVAGEPSLHVCRTCGKGFFSREDSVAHMRLCSRIIKLKEKIKG
jgi:hypothetical protein